MKFLFLFLIYSCSTTVEKKEEKNVYIEEICKYKGDVFKDISYKLNKIGECLIDKDESKAEFYFERSLSYKSNYVPALNNLGVLYFKMKKYTESYVLFLKASRIKIHDITRYNDIVVKNKGGFLDSILPYIQTLIDNNSKYSKTLNEIKIEIINNKDKLRV